MKLHTPRPLNVVAESAYATNAFVVVSHHMVFMRHKMLFPEIMLPKWLKIMAPE